LRLGSLNSAYAVRAESHRQALDAELRGASISAPSEQRLMRAIRDLRLVLPFHLGVEH
jgi:hypothetical protein